MKPFFEALERFLKRYFHKRNFIIVSEHKVKHIPISGHLQFLAVTLLVTGVCWAAYSTGSYMAARLALREQGQALRSVANARVETSFNSIFHLSPLADASTDIPASPPMGVPLVEPMVTNTALDHDKLYARIAYLEYKMSEMKDTNDAILQRVREKTSGRIGDLENIIRHTGLNTEEMRKQAEAAKPKHGGQGGPYIPDDMSEVTPAESVIYANLETLDVLNNIVGNLPLAMPIHDAERQSPFGHRIDPFTGHLAFHSGLDLSGPAGSKIYAPADGKVISAGRAGAYGNAIDLDHGFGITTRYGHLSQILVQEGQSVKKGEVIGIQGSTGRSTGPHLHYEVRYHDKAMNPENFLTVSNYVPQN